MKEECVKQTKKRHERKTSRKRGVVYGVGVNDYKGNLKENIEVEMAYMTWNGMLRRCYSKEYLAKKPTYIGCTVSDEWLSFSKFKVWFDENFRWDLYKMGIKTTLDKDLIKKGNKMYSPETCVFLPPKVNTFISTNVQSTNTKGWIGVSKVDRGWVSAIGCFYEKKRKYLGYFINIEDAGKAYIDARKQQVEKVKEYMRGLLYSEDIISLIK